jgi:hypothetical protein
VDHEWHSGAWIDVLGLPIPQAIAEMEQTPYRLQLETYLERCAMVLEGWHSRDAHNLGLFPWKWVDYERQLACLYVEVDGFPDLRLFVWLNDFVYAESQTIYVLAVNEDGSTYIKEDGMNAILRRRDDMITQLTSGES